MKNQRLVIPRFRFVKEYHDEKGSVIWEKTWYFHEWELMTALLMYEKAIDHWLPDNGKAKVVLYDGDRVIIQYGYGDAHGPCGFVPCGCDCSICPIGGGI